MAIGLTVHIKGAKELERKLDGLGQKYLHKVVAGAVRDGSRVIMKRTKAIAPVGMVGKRRARIFKGGARQQHAPGYMKKSIIVRAARRNRPGTFAMLQFFDTRRFPDLVVETVRRFHTTGKRRRGQRYERAFKGGPRHRRYFYPAALEYGHDNVASRPFIKRGFDQSKRLAASVILRKLRTGIIRIAKQRA